MKHKLDFYTQYNQFYLSSDGGSALKANATNWTVEAYEDRLALLENLIVFFTESYGHIKGELEILDEEPKKLDFFSDFFSAESPFSGTLR